MRLEGEKKGAKENMSRNKRNSSSEENNKGNRQTRLQTGSERRKFLKAKGRRSGKKEEREPMKR